MESPPSSIDWAARWLDSPARWDKLAESLSRIGEAGYDSETYNQPFRTSPQHRTRIHHWSIAFLTDNRTVRGYRRAKGYALPREALFHPPLTKALLGAKLWAHNAPHDEHSARNEGLPLRVHDTLQWARVAVPGMSSFSLKSKGKLIGIEQWALGKPGRDGYKDLVKYRELREVTKEKNVKVCACGTEGCRKRSTSEYLDPYDWQWKPHERVTVRQPVTEVKEVEDEYPITTFVPGHPRWLDWLKYVVSDAETGIELVDWLRNRHYEQKRYPWDLSATF